MIEKPAQFPYFKPVISKANDMQHVYIGSVLLTSTADGCLCWPSLAGLNTFFTCEVIIVVFLNIWMPFNE